MTCKYTIHKVWPFKWPALIQGPQVQCTITVLQAASCCFGSPATGRSHL